MAEIECLRNQQDQIQALTNIYLDQIQITKQTAPFKFSILCKPFRGNQLQYQLNIMFEFTKTYPKTPIKYDFQPLVGITRDNIQSIIKKIEELMLQNQAKPIVYDIVEETRLWIEQYLVEGKAYQVEEVIKVKKQQIFERPKFASFTIVTIQSFTEWKKQFDAKYKLAKIQKKQGEIKPTGKQWFLGKHEDIVDSEEEDEDEEEEEVEAEVEQPRQENNDLF